MTPPPRDTTAGLVPEIFTIDEAAVILRVKKSWLEKKAAARRIPFSMLGGSYHFSPAHLWQIFNEFEQKSESSTPSAPQPILAVRRKRRDHIETADPRVVPLRPRPPRNRLQNQIAA
ncbi:helix-turn-helix domain-containing protein [Actinoplanes sp. NEAU-A12]|uniref:Helix-turn-helix domain-containing protein n=1 Tax=Actinoplanes sandaracinus TaxID=3045177 RepID=A0ABT6WQ58_9ACTN|nr:helix-turn-helix domain-containing protein [Actinoplanes sandaracinus]MDI6101877.1 helix-turn-helix domain-containing protein [Actinoplanes sandaracinus]